MLHRKGELWGEMENIMLVCYSERGTLIDMAHLPIVVN